MTTSRRTRDLNPLLDDLAPNPDPDPDPVGADDIAARARTRHLEGASELRRGDAARQGL